MDRLTRKRRWVWRGPRRAITLDVDSVVGGLLSLRWTLRGIKVWDVGALGWGSLSVVLAPEAEILGERR